MTWPEREDELAMMNDPERWPAYPRLPLKKRGAQDATLGFLVAHGAHGVEPVVYLANLFAQVPDWNAVPQEKFESFDALLDAGWVVD